MRLAFYRSLWGATEPWEQALERFRSEGFDGVEFMLPQESDMRRFGAVLERERLEYIPIVLTTGEDVDTHLNSLRQELARAGDLGVTRVNCHVGLDSWRRDDARRFMDGALGLEENGRPELVFETHRGRIFFNPWVTAEMLQEFPTLKLCCDLSHWVVVAERLLDDVEVAPCSSRCRHIHARVGWEQGPQVPDPSAPEYEPHLLAHEGWWESLLNSQREQGMPVGTVCFEYGPVPYMPALPHTVAPVADLNNIVNWQADRFRNRFKKILASET
jgi:hypothetical protein